MKHPILLLMLVFTAMTVSANDSPCEVNLYQSQSQFNKAIQKPGDKNFIRITNQKNITLPEVMAKADRFHIVKPKFQEKVVVNDTEETEVDFDSSDSEGGSIFGGMFDLLVPAKLRNPAR